MTLVRRKRQQPVESLQHFADMESGRKRTLARHILVEMADVGGEHNESPAGPDPNELKPGRMPSGRVYCKARSKLCVAIIEQDAARIIQPHDSADVLDLE